MPTAKCRIRRRQIYSPDFAFDACTQVNSELKLEQVGGPHLSAQSIPLIGGVLLGRGTDCQVLLPDAAISRRHALIEQRGEQYWLTDLDSRSGTFINDCAWMPSWPCRWVNTTEFASALGASECGRVQRYPARMPAVA